MMGRIVPHNKSKKQSSFLDDYYLKRESVPKKKVF